MCFGFELFWTEGGENMKKEYTATVLICFGELTEVVGRYRSTHGCGGGSMCQQQDNFVFRAFH